MAITAASKVFSSHFKNWEIIVVDDGSRDNTKDIVGEVAEDDNRIRIVSHATNIGYGGALRTGFRNSKYDLVFFTDSDGQFDIREIELFLPYLARADIVTGFRIKRADPFHRLINAWLYNWLIRRMFGIRIKDVNCAFKFIKRNVLDSISLESSGALINAEILYKAQMRGFKIREVGIRHYPRIKGSQTGAKLSVIFRMFFELAKWRIKWAGIA